MVKAQIKVTTNMLNNCAEVQQYIKIRFVTLVMATNMLQIRLDNHFLISR